jgi:hypothetical protein
MDRELVEMLMDVLMPSEDMPEDMPDDVASGGGDDPDMIEQNGLDILALKQKKLRLLELLESL